MKNDIIEKINSAEKIAESIIVQSKKEADILLLNVQNEMEKLRQKVLLDNKKILGQKVRKAEQEIKQNTELKLNEYALSCNQVKEKALSKFDEAISIILSGVEDGYC